MLNGKAYKDININDQNALRNFMATIYIFCS